MKLATLALVVFGACGGGGDHPAKPAGKHVRLEDQPVADWIGVPMSGDAVVTMDVQGQEDLTTAKGRVEVTCPKGCRIGDDKTKLPDKSGFTDGITIPHIDLDRVDIALAIGGGKATIERFEVTSQDLVVRVTGGARLDKPFDKTQLDLCVRFGATPALQQRDPKAFALLQTTGAATGADNMSYIAVTGTVGETRMMARVCDGSAPAPAMPTAPKLAVRPDLSAPQLAAPDVAEPDLTGAVTKTSDTTFDIDAAKLATAFQNPMGVARDARLVPAVKDGTSSGLKLYAIKPGSVFAQAGLENGDLVISVGGFSLSAADRALEAYTKLAALKPGESFQIELERAGARRTHIYTLR